MIGNNKNITANRGLAIDNSGRNNRSNVIVNNVAKLPSILNPLLEKIIEENDRIESIEVDTSGEVPPDVEEKITFNSVLVWADLLRESAGYMSLIEEIINTIDDENPNAKNSFLKAIKRNYNNHKRSLLIENSIDPQNTDAVQVLICSHADKLIQSVANSILEHAECELDYPIELVQSAQELLVGYGFINCRILERPK